MIWRGEVHDIDLDQPVGHEPGFARPAVIVSTDVVNNGAGGLVVVVPVGSRSYGLRSQVELRPSGSGLRHVSYARCDQLRVVATERVTRRRGTVAPAELRTIEQALRFILDL